MALLARMSFKPRIVYSTDPKDRFECKRCGHLLNECRCVPIENVAMDKIVVNIRIEKGGRGGKTVTVLADLPKNEDFLKKLSKELKTRCGVGGTYVLTREDCRIEIQGDQRDAIKKILTSKQIKFKGM